ncbi:MAG: hypothetical protein AABZ39_08565 [Spirochaetota bacterium]
MDQACDRCERSTTRLYDVTAKNDRFRLVCSKCFIELELGKKAAGHDAKPARDDEVKE